MSFHWLSVEFGIAFIKFIFEMLKDLNFGPINLNIMLDKILEIFKPNTLKISSKNIINKD